MLGVGVAVDDQERLQAAVIDTLLTGIQEALIVAEAETGRIVMWNNAAEAIFGYTASEVLGGRITELLPEAETRPTDRGEDSGSAAPFGPFVDAPRTVELPSRRKSGEAIDVEVSFGSFYGPNGELFLMAVPHDISARKRLERQLQRSIADLTEANRQLQELAATDTLTGLANRNRAREMLEKFALLARRNDRPLALAFLDLDHFKHVNDQYGHMAGDDVLRHLGALLQRSFRGEDVVARWGGEEFIAGMFGMNKPDAVKRLSSVLESFRQQPFETPGGVFRVTCSAGVAEYASDADGIEGLFAKADAALYRAKEAGRNRVVAADDC